MFSESLHNFKHITLRATITVKLFDNMSNIVDISIDTALDLTVNLDGLGVMWYRSELRQNENSLKYIWNVPRNESNNSFYSGKKEIGIVPNDADPASLSTMWASYYFRILYVRTTYK